MQLPVIRIFIFLSYSLNLSVIFTPFSSSSSSPSFSSCVSHFSLYFTSSHFLPLLYLSTPSLFFHMLISSSLPSTSLSLSSFCTFFLAYDLECLQEAIWEAIFHWRAIFEPGRQIRQITSSPDSYL